MKTSEIKLPKIIGAAGCARSGKDTLYALTCEVLSKNDNLKIMRAGFADAVKQDLHQLLVKKAGISAYTEVPEEKELIRGLMVEYGTNLMRRLDEDVWIRRMKLNLDLAKNVNANLFITDVRYENEIDWIQENEGIVVYVEQSGRKPINEEEKKNDPILRSKSNFSIQWDHVGENKLKSLKPKVRNLLKEVSC